MERAPRLRLTPRPSRIGCAAVLVGCVLASTLLAVLPLAAIVPGAFIVAAVLVAGLWRCTGRGLPALLYVGIDRRIAVTDYDGRARTGAILDDSYVGEWLTTIVWQPDATPWWRPATTIVVLPDMLPREELRCLRVALRYGRPASAGGMSEVDAG